MTSTTIEVRSVESLPLAIVRARCSASVFSSAIAGTSREIYSAWSEDPALLTTEIFSLLS